PRSITSRRIVTLPPVGLNSSLPPRRSLHPSCLTVLCQSSEVEQRDRGGCRHVERLHVPADGDMKPQGRSFERRLGQSPAFVPECDHGPGGNRVNLIKAAAPFAG